MEAVALRQEQGVLSGVLMWPALVAMAPLIRVLPQDIGLLIFEAGDPGP